jgi:hypothetical protein
VRRTPALITSLVGVLAALGLAAAPLAAQVVPDSVRRDSVAVADSVTAPLVAPRLGGDTVRRVPRRAPVLSPPVSPRKAFLLSALLPGYAQTRLERGTSGAFFAGIEMASVAMLRRSVNDLREVRRASRDTLPGNFVINPNTGERAPTTAGGVPPRFDASIERSRALHIEDWTAAIVFNHLIAGADAFVSAQLWDVPTRLTMVPTAQGLALVATVRW